MRASAVALVVAVGTGAAALSCASLIGVSDEVSYGDAGIAKDSGAERGIKDGRGRDGEGGGADRAETCHACVEAVPAGWSGPIALFDSTGSPPTAFPGCTGPYSSLAFQGHAQPTFDAGACECTCNVVGPPGCDAGVVATFSNGACLGASSPSCTDAAALQGACMQSPACSAGSLYVSLGTVLPSGGTCGAVQPTLPPSSWSEVGGGCSLGGGPTRGPCDAGQICAPAPPSGFEGAVCIFHAGDVACPAAGPYSKQHLYFGDAKDDRSCACTCGSPKGGACQPLIQVYGSGGCATPSGPPISVTNNACSYVGPKEAPISVAYSAEDASCAPVTAVITGKVVGASPATVCCTR